jgi:ABC-type glutathione transport system ATPase component
MGAAISTTNSAAGRDPLMVPPQVGAHLSVPISVAPKQMSSRGKSSFQMTGMPFTPVTLAWRDIHYYVTVKAPKGKQTITKHLLKGISGYSKPGSLTALMGSSGAGKTTLMDVIAGRKTVGKITGDILVNGRPKDTQSFNHLTGYVEQVSFASLSS